MRMIVSDLSSVEFGVVGWLARSHGIMEVIRNKREAYLDFACKLYHEKGYDYDDLYRRYKAGEAFVKELRQFSKPPVLGCGFGLGGGELYTNQFGDVVRGGLWGYALNVCGVDMPRDLAHRAVAIYRKEYWEVPRLWASMEMGFKQVLKDGGTIDLSKCWYDKKEKKWWDYSPDFHIGCPNFQGSGVIFSRKKSKSNGYIMRMQLPSGRFLNYLNAQTKRETVKGNDGPWETDVIYYEGIEHSSVEQEDGSTKKGQAKWGLTHTYGGKLTENGVQAIARDILVSGWKAAREMGFKIWGCFHDELATLAPPECSLVDLNWCLSQPPIWAPDMLVGAAGWEGTYYHKG